MMENVNYLRNKPGFLEQILFYFGALDGTLLVEVDVDVLAEAARVVVANGFRIAKRLQNRIGLENLLFDPIVLTGYGSQELQNELGTLRLACARFSAYDHTLVVLVT